jgi:HAD superfamily hydrolase (TIGR01509 family)
VIEALLLDFDGLLYGTEDAVYDGWNALYTRYGLTLDLDLWVRESIGRPPGAADFDPVLHLQQLLGSELDVEALRAEGVQTKRDLLPHALLPGAEELLQRAAARRVKTAIVTSNHSANVRRHLQRAHTTHAFDAIISAEGDAARGKPNPTLYLEALDVLGVTTDRAIAFEDSPNGIAAAKAAGLVCIAVPNALTRGQPGIEAADRVLDSLHEVDLDDLDLSQPSQPTAR